MRPFPLLAVVMLVFTSGCEGGPERGLPAPTALETRGATLLEEGHDDEARVVFLQALQTAPRSFLAYIGLARAAVGLRDWVLFETAMSEALSTTPKTPEAHDIAGRTLLLAAKAGTGDRRRQHARLAGTMFAHASRQAPDLPQLRECRSC